jgi:hypothetical protein
MHYVQFNILPKTDPFTENFISRMRIDSTTSYVLRSWCSGLSKCTTIDI